jgi:hypothetical protein
VRSATASGRCVSACAVPLLSPCSGSDGTPSALPLQLCRADLQVPADLPLALSLMPILSGDCHRSALCPCPYYVCRFLLLSSPREDREDRQGGQSVPQGCPPCPPPTTRGGGQRTRPYRLECPAAKHGLRALRRALEAENCPDSHAIAGSGGQTRPVGILRPFPGAVEKQVGRTVFFNLC